MKRRRAETLAEFLVAMMVFATIMAGVFEFVANHTSNAARIKNWDFFMYYTQKWLNEKDGSIPASEEYQTLERGKIVFTKDGNILTVKQKDNDTLSMTFTVSNN